MSHKPPNRASTPAVIFAALGDETRLALVQKISTGKPTSVAKLAAGSRLTRQAVTKHLRVLERAGVVHSMRTGRENRYQLDPSPFVQMSVYLGKVSQQWDQALLRLQSHVEK